MLVWKLLRTLMVAIGMIMLAIGVSITDDTPIWVAMVLAFPGLALMFIFGVMFETERDY